MTGFVGIEEDYPVSIKEVLNITAETGTLETQSRIRKLPHYDESMSSAEPKKGKWIKISPANIYECSVCHQNVMTKDIEEYHFCHHCGADMRESE